MSTTTTLALIDKWGRDRNIIGDGTSPQQLAKLMEELGEMAGGIARKQPEVIKDGIGDAVVVLAMIAGIEGMTIAECIDAAYEEIKDRKGVLIDGVFIKDSDPRYGYMVAEAEHRRTAG